MKLIHTNWLATLLEGKSLFESDLLTVSSLKLQTALFFRKKKSKKERRMSFPPLQQLTQEKHHFDKKNDFSSKFNLMKAHGACGKFFLLISPLQQC